MVRPRDQIIYKNNWQYLTDELARFDLLLQLEVVNLRKSFPEKQQDTFKGLFLSDKEIDDILFEGSANSEKWDSQTKHDTQIRRLVNAIEGLQKTIPQKKKGALEKGVYLALPQLSRLFALSPFEENCVLVCLAPEVDGKYEKVFAYLQDDITRRRPSVNLILNLFCPTRQEMITARSYFLPQAPLFKSRILQVVENPQNPQPPFLSRFLKLDDRIVNFLLEVAALDERIESFSKLVYPQGGRSEVFLSQELQTRLLSLTKTRLGKLSEQPNKLIYYLSGPYGSGKQSLAEAICRELKVPLVVSDVGELLAGGFPFEETIRLVFREALLQPAAIYLKGFHHLLDGEQKYLSHLKIIVRTIEELSWLTFLVGEKTWEPAGLFNHNSFMKVNFPVPDYTARTELWKTMTDGKFQFSEEVDFGALGTKFRFTPGQVEDALVAGQNLAHLRQPNDPKITMQDLYQGCRAQCNKKLGTLAQKITPKYTWEDIVLRKDILQQLHAICDQVKYRHLVYGEWGFDQKLSLGKGLNALFSGSSGTGKTMGAEIIANELQLDLYKIDLSSVVSKYIGETEKNLSKIFHEAESSNAILFFDEADALFGKRSEVKDAHDRYANIEVGYLLQKMEEYEGVAILATNLKRNMDEGFMRRLHFVVEFPFPDENNRYQIWKNMFTQQVPLSDDIDFDLLAKRLKIAGGSIKNIVLNAAFLAAADSGTLNMQHLMIAANRELSRTGSSGLKLDLEKYTGMVET
ncbi:MAG: AAA family ATPase [Candidatus Hodarchaeota archaeon]